MIHVRINLLKYKVFCENCFGIELGRHHDRTYLREKLKPGVLGQRGIHVRELCHCAQKLDCLVISNRFQELVLTTNKLVEGG